MEKIGIFFALSGDIYQPSYRSDLIRICDVCFVYINDNIKNLINNGYLVECHVLLNYQNELIPNLVESIKEIFLKYSINIEIEVKKIDIIKQEFLNNIGYYDDYDIDYPNYYSNNRTKIIFDSILEKKPSLWVQIFQFLYQSNKNLKYDFFIRSRLDVFLNDEFIYLSLIKRFTSAYNLSFQGENCSQGYAIVPHIIFDGLDFGVNVRDECFVLDESAVHTCFSNLYYICDLELSYYNEHHILSNLLLKNHIITLASQEADNMFTYRSQVCDKFSDDFMKRKENLNYIAAELATEKNPNHVF